MQRSVLVLCAALAATAALGSPARANDPSGSFLGDYYLSQARWGIPGEEQPQVTFIAGLRSQYLDRELCFDGFSESFGGFQIGPEITVGYRKLFLTGSYLRSVTSEDFGADETTTWGYNFHLGYATQASKNLIIAPVVGYGSQQTELESKVGNFESTEGVSGVNFGLLATWTPKYDLMAKPFPKWQINFGALYYPSLCVSDDFGGDADGDYGWTVQAALRYNLSPRSSLSAGFSYGERRFNAFNQDGKLRDWTASLNYTFDLSR